MKLICAFVFAQAFCWFSYAVAHLMLNIYVADHEISHLICVAGSLKPGMTKISLCSWKGGLKAGKFRKINVKRFFHQGMEIYQVTDQPVQATR